MSICQTRFRRVGGCRNTSRRAAAQALRSARNPCGSSRSRRRSARSTVLVDTWCPSARIIAAILRCPHAGQSSAYFAATGSTVSTTGAGHGPFAGLSPARETASRRQ